MKKKMAAVATVDGNGLSATGVTVKGTAAQAFVALSATPADSTSSRAWRIASGSAENLRSFREQIEIGFMQVRAVHVIYKAIINPFQPDRAVLENFGYMISGRINIGVA